jgi:mRNA interferase MazF
VRGEVFHLTMPRTQGHEQAGTRFAVVVQSDDLLASSTWLVAPTSTSTHGRSYHPEIEVQGQATRVMVEQTTAVDHRRLGALVGYLSLDEMDRVDEALRFVLDL